MADPTRRVLLGGAAATLVSPAWAQARWLTPSEVLRSGMSDQLLLEALFAAAAESGRPAKLDPGRTYNIESDFLVTAPNFHFDGVGADIVQRTNGHGFLQLRGTRANVSNIRLRFDGMRTPPRGSFRGYNGFQRMCAVWLEGDNAQISNVAGSNLFGVVCLRGPVDRRDGANDSSDGSAYVYTRRMLGNVVRDTKGSGCDFVLTGNQQENLLIDGLVSNNTTHLSVPPHAIYMNNPATDGIGSGYAKNVVARRLVATENPYSQGFKFNDIQGLKVIQPKATRAAGCLIVSSSVDVVIQQPIADRMYSSDGSSFYAIEISQSKQVRIVGGTATVAKASFGGGVAVAHGSTDVEVSDFSITDNFLTSGAVSPYRVGDTSEARFIRCSRIQTGAPKEMFVATEQGSVAAVSPKNQGQGPVCRTTQGAICHASP